MYCHVVGALKKCGVNRKERLQPLCGQSASKERGVLFSYADIEVATGMRLLKMRETGAARHRRCYCYKLLICLREFRQRLADDFRISGRRRRRGLATLDLIFAETVEFIRLLKRWGVALAFLSENMQQDWFFLRFQKLECADEQRNIVPIDRAIVTQPQLFEDYARQQ